MNTNLLSPVKLLASNFNFPRFSQLIVVEIICVRVIPEKPGVETVAGTTDDIVDNLVEIVLMNMLAMNKTAC